MNITVKILSVVSFLFIFLLCENPFSSEEFKDLNFIYGNYTQDGFVEQTPINIITNAQDIYDINKAIQSGKSRVFEITLIGSKYDLTGELENRPELYVTFSCIGENGIPISSQKEIMKFYRVDNTDKFRTKIYVGENNSEPKGKVVVMVTNEDLSGKEYDYVYVLFGEYGCKLKMEIEYKQY